MKPLHKKLLGLLFTLLLFSGYSAVGQNAKKSSLSISVGFYSQNNLVPYIKATVKTKVGGRFKTMAGIPLALYINNADEADNLIANVVTNDKGEAAATIPVSLRAKWGAGPSHTFVATFKGSKEYEANSGDVTVGRAKIDIDTTSDRKIFATVYAMADSGWKPVKGVDVIVAIKRLDANLNVNETASFSTDSTGTASADFKRDSILGDANGNITLVARVEDNDQFGNLYIEKTVPWGAKFIPVNTFDRRTLFATRDKAPVWLILMATSIIVAVWGILIGLVANLLKIKKLGQQSA